MAPRRGRATPFDLVPGVHNRHSVTVVEKSADSNMRNIVTSIQREQNRIIRDETHPLLVVQGPAGSGKTSVALHRIAYLLYRFRDELAAHNVLVISPSDLFNEYISGVLPELGEQNRGPLDNAMPRGRADIAQYQLDG